MEIYTFNSPTNTLMNVIYIIGAVVLTFLLFFIAKFWIAKIIAYRRDNIKIPKRLTAFFSVFIFVLLIGYVVLGTIFVKNVTYGYNMKNGKAMCFVGDPTVISCKESYYRDEFMGYEVKLQIDGQTISPLNTFPKEVITYLESDEKLIIQYGIIENDGLYVWSIKTVQE